MSAEGSGLRPLEVASGLVLGLGPELEAVPPPLPGESARAALERAVLPALSRPPCLVSFSGGRDSSAVLATAVHVARREGLSLPIPATNRFPSVQESRESEWQERVVAHLGLKEWARLDHGSELDCVGPISAEILRKHGLLWPFNAHFHVPLLRLASGGSLLTGIGGDEVFGATSWSRVSDVLRARVLPEPKDVLRVGFLVAPRAIRRRVLQRRLPLEFSWLLPAARRTFAAAWARQAATEPLGWAAHVRWVRRLRYLRVGTSSLRKLAADETVLLVHPFLDGGHARAIAELRPEERFGHRTAAMRMLFGDLLPDDVLTRSSKASFDAAFWNDASRAFADEWSGEGIDQRLVDVDALRAEWRSEAPDPRTFTLAQAAWLAQDAGSAGHCLEQTFDGLGQ